MGQFRLSPEVADAVGAVVEEVTGEVRLRRGNEICAPFWLIDLGLRLCQGEKVLYVEPGELWRSTVEMLSRREVQAIVIAPAGQLAVPETGED
jgi:hypothetical protein